MTYPRRALAVLLFVAAVGVTSTGAIAIQHSPTHSQVGGAVVAEGPPTCCGGGQDTNTT
ncbi:MAG TPA: hypothetical protein VGG25_25955 [Streptosporangiaceae bacterium]|jgi:hypothetical protein